MLVYKQRYKPRTSREFTKSDLTVYDSADNTALNTLTVYGKSEVVDGAIKNAGEGWTTVDLGTLTWGKNSHSTLGDYFFADVTAFNVKYEGGFGTTTYNVVTPRYSTTKRTPTLFKNDTICFDGAEINQRVTQVQIKDSRYTDATAFTNSLNGVLLCYQLVDPTQGNAIAVKTDNGSGIDGTMATFSTGTPLRGIPETTVRDVMVWDGTSGEVTKICGEVDLGTLNWSYYNDGIFYTQELAQAKSNSPNCICEKYKTQPVPLINPTNKTIYIAASGANPVVRICDTDYTDPTTFKNSLNGVMLVYELPAPTTEQLTAAENASIAGLRTFAPNTHAQNNAGADMTVNYTIRVPTV